MKNFISIVIPAYNEENRIGKTLEKIIEFLSGKPYSYDIIVVDDGSSDSTSSVVESVKNVQLSNSNLRLMKNEVNKGKGASVKKGVLSCESDYVYFTDADLSTPIEELDNFLENSKKGSYDVVIGSRSIRGANVVVHQPLYRELAGKIFNKIVRLFCLGGFIDTQCGAKLFTGTAAKEIFSQQELDGFAFDVEILYVAKKLGMKIYEMPVKWINSNTSRVRLFRDSMKMFIDTVKIRNIHK